MKKILSIFTLSVASVASFAQYEISSFTSTGRGGATSFVTDYQCAGINPANLGWLSEFEDKKFAMGYNELTFSLHSEALTKDELRQEFKDIINNRSTADWTIDEKKQAGNDFANSGLAVNADFGLFGFSFATEKFGGIAFRINDNANMYMRLNEEVSEILFMGKYASYFDSLVYIDPTTFDTSIIANYDIQDADSLQNIVSGFAALPSYIGQIMNGSEIRASWTREFNLSYGRKLFGTEGSFEVFGGVGLKYIRGFAMANIKSEDNVLSAFMAVSPAFNIDFGSASVQNPSSITQSGTLPDAVGQGFGMDLGLDFLIKGKLKLAFAVTNIGSVKWNGNVYTVQDTLVIDTESGGLNNYNVLATFEEVTGDDGLFKWEGKQEIVQKLPTLLRMGGSIPLGEIAQIGMDVLIPIQDESPASFEKAVIGLGGDIKPIPWLRLSAGFMTGGNYDFSIPIGLTFIGGKGTWEGGIASRDAVTFFTQNGPTLSLSTGFLRFRF